MNPRPAKELIPKTVLDTGLSEELVTDILDVYWRMVHQELSSLKWVRIQIPGLGTFKVKKNRLYKEVEKITNILKPNIELTTFQRMKRHKLLVDKLETINKLIKIYDKEYLEKKEFNEKKNAKKKSN